jgi:hypothetical protein
MVGGAFFVAHALLSTVLIMVGFNNEGNLALQARIAQGWLDWPVDALARKTLLALRPVLELTSKVTGLFLGTVIKISALQVFIVYGGGFYFAVGMLLFLLLAQVSAGRIAQRGRGQQTL